MRCFDCEQLLCKSSQGWFVDPSKCKRCEVGTEGTQSAAHTVYNVYNNVYKPDKMCHSDAMELYATHYIKDGARKLIGMQSLNF